MSVFGGCGVVFARVCVSPLSRPTVITPRLTPTTNTPQHTHNRHKKKQDTDFAADLTVVEEASELVARLTKAWAGQPGPPLPMFTSCCPAW